MGQEIERKFLLRNDNWRKAANAGTRIRQGYLSEVPERTVRVRVIGETGFLTVKGKNEGSVRAEFEYPIPVADARALLALCLPPLVEKTRYLVMHEGHTWEIDVFEGANAGLVVAEVELRSETEPISLPDWIGREVTSDTRYYNSNLRTHPFSNWSTTAPQ